MTIVNWLNDEVHQGKTVVFKAGVGSTNYNLFIEPEKQEDHPNLLAHLLEAGSDYDFKMFVTPTLSDLINKYEHGIAFVEEGVGDGESHDIRKLKKLFTSANINFLETLFSKSFSANAKFMNEVSRLLVLRHKIAKMNLRAFYNGIYGGLRNELKHIESGNTKTQALVERYGFDTKNAMGADRLLSTFFKFRESGHSDFGYAISCTGDLREYLLDLRRGKVSLEQAMFRINTMKEVFVSLEEEYQQYRIDEDADAEVVSIIHDICAKSLMYELSAPQ